MVFFLADKIEDLSTEFSLSDSSEGLLSRGVGGARV